MSNSRCYKVLWSGAYASAARMLPEMRCSMKPMTGSAASALTIRPTTTFGICAGAGLEVKLELPAALKAGSYRFGALERIRGKDRISGGRMG